MSGVPLISNQLLPARCGGIGGEFVVSDVVCDVVELSDVALAAVVGRLQKTGRLVGRREDRLSA